MSKSTTILLIDQIKASRALREDALSNIESLSDADLRQALSDVASASTVDRVLSIASASTVARVLSIASDDTVDRVNFFKTLTVPVVSDLDRRILEAAEAGNLKMDRWHCGTTHCRAGWAVIFGGDDGQKLEDALGSEAAGRLIYEASTGRMAPDFFASNEEAIADIRRCAGVSE